MTPLQSPTSPTFDSYPTTPLTPTFAHAIDSHVNSPHPSPRLRVVTSFPFQQMQLLTPVANKPQNYSGLKALHKRDSSSVSTLSFLSPADTFFNNIPPTPKTPVPNVLFRSMLSPGGPAREDGRQSRMAMRSPILERILTLPIRLSTSARTPPSETRFPNPPNSMASALPFEEDDMAICSPFPFPQQTPTPTIQISSPSHRRTFSTTSTLINTSQPAAPRRIPKRPLSPPPHYHMTLAPSLSSTVNNNTPPPPPSHFPTPAHRTAYTNAITHLSTPLVPLISVTSGVPHPEFPRSLLQYHLLTHAQLDDLARWYHQTQPACAESWMYPAWIPPYTDREAGGGMGIEDGDVEVKVELGTKRRRWGRFIGLRGCESPTATGNEAGGNGSGCGIESGNGEGLVERMEREWLRARERAREEEIAREKGWRGRW